MLTKSFECANPDETAQLASRIQREIEVPFLITLSGGLGAGKTEFVRDILAHYGITSVKSPTFTIVREYEPGFKVYHIDAYRLGGSDDFLDAGLDEYFYRGGVCVIEWSSVIDDLLPEDTVRIKITGTGDTRKIEVD